MTDALLVSVIIASYNTDRYLGEALSSVLEQTYRPLEIIVVDDGSTDRTAEVVRQFGSAVRYDFQPHGGISTAVNRGIHLARGDYLAFLDADDLWTPEKLTQQMAALEANPELEAVFGAVECFLSPELEPETRRKLVCPEGLLTAQMKPAMLIRRTAFTRIGLFDVNLRIGEFIDWQARARDAGLRTSTLPQLVLRRRIHGANTTLRESASKTDYVRIARAALLRRRQQSSDAKILILGASGMLGHTLFEVLSRLPTLETHAAVRRPEAIVGRVPAALQARIHNGGDAADHDSTRQLLDTVRPDVLINCIGIVKQLPTANDPVGLITANALLPHRLAQHCRVHGIRLIHFSTDCVFSGARGHYSETHDADPTDRYGCSKLLGEPIDGAALTLRTSIIGHELHTNHGLLEWFLSRRGSVDGFRSAIFSGLPTFEIAHILSQHILPNPGLVGVHHVAAEPISKLELLRLIADRYGRRIDIVDVPGPAIDRSLDATRFKIATGYTAPPWSQLIDTMFTDATTRYPDRQLSSGSEAHVPL